MTKMHKNHKTLQICTSLHDRNMRNEKKGTGANSGLHVTLHIHTCSSHNCIISLMQRPNPDTEPNKPLTLSRTQVLIRYMVTRPIHTVTIWCYVTQQHNKCIHSITASLHSKTPPPSVSFIAMDTQYFLNPSQSLLVRCAAMPL